MKNIRILLFGILAVAGIFFPGKLEARPRPEVLSSCHTGSGWYQGYPYWGSVCYNGIGVQRAEMHTVNGQVIYGPCVGQDAWSNAISWGGQPVAWGRIDHGC